MIAQNDYIAAKKSLSSLYPNPEAMDESVKKRKFDRPATISCNADLDK